MRKGQVIAAIEDRQQHANSVGDAAGNSVKRNVPAGAGTARPFEQDAMESEESGQLSMVNEFTAGLGEPGISEPANSAAVVAAPDD